LGRNLHIAPGTHPSALNAAEDQAIVQPHPIAGRYDHIARVPKPQSICNELGPITDLYSVGRNFHIAAGTYPIALNAAEDQAVV
jgi:hypothetical protein